VVDYLHYSGNETLARKFLMQALEMDPDNEDIKRAIKNIKRSSDMKEEASSLFKSESDSSFY